MAEGERTHKHMKRYYALGTVDGSGFLRSVKAKPFGWA